MGYAIYLVVTSLKGVSSMKLHRDLKISQKSAWHLAHRIRAAWNGDMADLFDGPAEVDEARRRTSTPTRSCTLAGAPWVSWRWQV